MEMEHARDDLMYEVHKLQQGSVDYEKNVCLFFFDSEAVQIWSMKFFDLKIIV